jgi:small GTP-binding protein
VLPVIALVGRPNVGKSTLFNWLTRTRDALVADLPGLTRDRQYGYTSVGPRRCVVIDTGGLVETAAGVERLMAEQTLKAVAEADRVLFDTIAQRFRSGPERKLQRLPLHLNDEAFAAALVASWHEISRSAVGVRRA